MNSINEKKSLIFILCLIIIILLLIFIPVNRADKKDRNGREKRSEKSNNYNKNSDDFIKIYSKNDPFSSNKLSPSPSSFFNLNDISKKEYNSKYNTPVAKSQRKVSFSKETF